jgi:hypothetical protein
MDGGALLKATILSKSREYYQILSSLKAPHYCSKGDYNKYGGATARIGKRAVGKGENPDSKAPSARRGRDMWFALGSCRF